MSPLCLLFLCVLKFPEISGYSYYSESDPGRVHKLLLILVDGCRWDYPDQDIAGLPGFRKLAENGVRAPYVTPIFPSNSYPNWYTLVTATLHEDNYFPAEYEKKLIRLYDHPAKQRKGVNIYTRQNTNITDADLVYYTDGSQIDDNTGCAYIALRNQDTLTLWEDHLDTNNSVFQSEVLAIDRALTHIIQQQYNGSFILTGSLSSLHALLNPMHCSPLIAGIQSKLHDNSNLNVKLQWIKAHVGQIGNEMADQLAKEAAQNLNAEQITIPRPIYWLNKNLTQKIKSLWQEEWNSDDTGRRVFYHIPIVTYDRLIIHGQLIRYKTGHGPFPVYFERFGIANTAQCICGELGTPEHYVANCPLTTDLHLPIPPTNEQAFSRFMIKNKHTIRKINKIVNKLMDLGTDLCQI